MNEKQYRHELEKLRMKVLTIEDLARQHLNNIDAPEGTQKYGERWGRYETAGLIRKSIEAILDGVNYGGM